MTDAPIRTEPRAGALTRRLHPRRVAAWAVLAPLVGAIGWGVLHPGDPAGVVGLTLVAVLGAATLADYVPTSGRTLDVGCGSCAVGAALSVPAAILLSTAVGPLFGVAIATAGLLQRLRQPDACPT
ncbi:hypothetical protein OEB99_18435 [Actinotalea sp. M2MS4P-6]|uniref:hypothetical protein n=1 Tax=Actinotalea sp. M2MS4P-6 TaxID=2983762 RepID=UPI0021E476F3|nr:hypothetical protein [Actinotalea sp. M2MS4P-6]MCV2396293.1 hypothetical protein [Actinotalea sp. M2MS4P-6]